MAISCYFIGHPSWSSFSADCFSDACFSMSCPSSQLSSPDEEESTLFLRLRLSSFTLNGEDTGRVHCSKYLHVLVFLGFSPLTTFLHATFPLSLRTLQCMHPNLALIWGPFIPFVGHFGRNSSMNARIDRLWVSTPFSPQIDSDISVSSSGHAYPLLLTAILS